MSMRALKSPTCDQSKVHFGPDIGESFRPDQVTRDFKHNARLLGRVRG
jgi:hypothetical protein